MYNRLDKFGRLFQRRLWLKKGCSAADDDNDVGIIMRWDG
jgi:hypothetical protein